jgi:iron(III) transport system substrate-binding protein
MSHHDSKHHRKFSLVRFPAYAITSIAIAILFAHGPQAGRRGIASEGWLAVSSLAAAGEATRPAGARWEASVKEAKSEGKITLLGPETAGVRPALVEAFRKAYPDIELEYQSGSVGSLAARLRAEISQKKTTFDVVIGGTAVLRTKDLLDLLPARLFVSEAMDAKHWRSSEGNGLKWIDHERQFALQTSEWVFGYIVLNSRSVNPASIKSWSDLLKPEWKGKIASHDPRGAGAGQEVASYLVDKLGGKFIVDLFKGQEVVLTRSYSQVADWVAQGKYQIGIAQVPDRIEALKKDWHWDTLDTGGW